MRTGSRCGRCALFFGLALGLALTGCTSQESTPPPPSATELLQRIPAGDPAQWDKPGAVKNWPNPYLVLREDGVGLLDPANNEIRVLKTDEVLDALARLPASAWPRGRVVAVQGPGKVSEEHAIAFRRSRGILGGTLEGAHVAIVWLPVG